MLSRQVPLVGQIDKQVLIAAARRVIHLPPASLSANNCKNATKMDLGGSCTTANAWDTDTGDTGAVCDV